VEVEKEEVVKQSKDLEERSLFKTDIEGEEDSEEENLQDISNIKIRREEGGVGKKDLNKEEMEYGSCCDSSHDGENSILHNFSRPPRPSSSSSLAPSIEDFEILKPISRGAFGKVFLCHRRNQKEKKLAVKVMRKAMMVQKNMVHQVISERNAAALAKSEFCVPLLYCLQTPNNVFMVMEYMIGGDLKSLLGMYGCFPEHQAVFYLASMVLALQYLHKRGIVHRDIKPDNMLLSASGHPKLTDFGLSTTGLRDRELQVADLVGRTPWHAGPQARFVRTPGQILSLTSHLSFSSQRSGDLPSGVLSPGGSFLHSSASTTNPLNCSTNSGTRTTPILPRSPSHPNSLPLARLSNSRPPLRRKNSFAESMAKCQSKAALEAKTPHSPKQGLLLGSSPTKDPDSSFQLQQMPNSSMDLGAGSKNQTIEWKSESSPMKASQSEREGKENVVPMLEGRHSPDLHLDLAFPDTQMLVAPVTPPKAESGSKTPPLRLFPEGDDSLGSLSSSPKPLASSLLPLSSPPISPVHGSHQSPLVKQATYLPTSPLQGSSPGSSPRSDGGLDKRLASPRSSPSSTPILSPKSCLGPHSAAAANMRALRQRSGNTPETLRTLFNEDSDLHLDATLDKMEQNVNNMVDFKKDFLDRSGLEEDEDGDVVFTVPGGTPVQHERLEKRFKMPTPFPLLSKKRKLSSFSSNCSSNSTGLTDDLTELAVLKRQKPSDNQAVPPSFDESWKICERKEVFSGSTSMTSRSSSEGLLPGDSRQSKSSCSSEEEQGIGYGCSTPVFSPLSAIPRRMKAGAKGKAVQFKSPAGVFTPVQPCKPGLTLAQLDAESVQMTTPPPHQQRTSSPAVAGLTTPFRTPTSAAAGDGGKDGSRLLGTPDYLAPELLLRQGHSQAVDWWALGCCLYEFLIGCPPFCGSSAEEVFENILNRHIEWPEEEESLSEAAVETILALLHTEPAARADGVMVKAMELTKEVDWEHLGEQEAPFVPMPDDASDTTYFNQRNVMQGLTVSEVDL